MHKIVTLTRYVEFITQTSCRLGVFYSNVLLNPHESPAREKLSTRTLWTSVPTELQSESKLLQKESSSKHYFEQNIILKRRLTPVFAYKLVFLIGMLLSGLSQKKKTWNLFHRNIPFVPLIP